eukprot:2187051-Rhodomonas_salina.3
MPGSHLARTTISLRPCYEMSGTDVRAYDGTRFRAFRLGTGVATSHSCTAARRVSTEAWVDFYQRAARASTETRIRPSTETRIDPVLKGGETRELPFLLRQQKEEFNVDKSGQLRYLPTRQSQLQETA